MNKKMYKLFSLFIVFFTMFLINNNVVFAGKVMCVDKNGNNTSCTDSKGATPVSVDENNDGQIDYYYVWWNEEPGADFEDEVTYRGTTYNGKSLKYYYITVDNEVIDLTTYKGTKYDYSEIYKNASENSKNAVYPDETSARERNEDTSIEQSRKDELNERSNYNPETSTIKNTDVDGLDPNSGSISINCSDFEALHIIYNLILIVAPILVIVFGTIDYSKAVMTSDLEKMDKFKKRFKPRLIAVIVLFLVPLLIKLLLSLNSDLSNTMLNCVVNGKDAEIKLNASEATGSSGVDTGSIKYKEGSSSKDTTGTGDGGGSSQSFGDTTNDTNTTESQNSNDSAKMPTKKTTTKSTGCSKCDNIPDSYTSAKNACKKANGCN